MKVQKKELISRGAEAELWKGEWRDRKVVVKKRVVKGYRHPQLDEDIRVKRIRKEARLIREARKVGVPVPIIYDMSEWDTTLVLQFFDGKRVMDCLKEGEDVDLTKIGRYIGKLHEAGITHGDLTTSNILFDEVENRYCFIDFSLGEKESSIEDIGVDLHLIREALISVHEEPIKKFASIMDGYKENCEDWGENRKKMEDIESRGRYT